MQRKKSSKNPHVPKYIPVFSMIFASPNGLSLRCAEVFDSSVMPFRNLQKASSLWERFHRESLPEFRRVVLKLPSARACRP